MQHDKLVEKEKMHPLENIRKYVREYKINLEKKPTDAIQRWLLGLNVVMKRASLCGSKDMQRYLRQ